MKATIKKLILSALFSCFTYNAMAMGDDNPVRVHWMLDEFEVRQSSGINVQEDSIPRTWDASVSIGKDLQKIWLNTSGEKTHGDTEQADIRLFYEQAWDANWNWLLGVRRDMTPEPERNWLEFGVKGLAPYFIETKISAFIGESGHSAVELIFEKEFMLTQRLVLSPEAEVIFYGHNDDETEVGSGLSSLELGLRLAYEIKREFAPYIGINWERAYGNTADYHRANGERTSDTQFVLGIRAWY